MWSGYFNIADISTPRHPSLTRLSQNQNYVTEQSSGQECNASPTVASTASPPPSRTVRRNVTFPKELGRSQGKSAVRFRLEPVTLTLEASFHAGMYSSKTRAAELWGEMQRIVQDVFQRYPVTPWSFYRVLSDGVCFECHGALDYVSACRHLHLGQFGRHQARPQRLGQSQLSCDLW